MTDSADVILSNEFGSVRTDRVGFYANKGWFSGGVFEELPIRHVTMVRFETTRNIVGAIILAVVGLLAMMGGTGGLIVALIFFALAALLVWGTPSVTINTAGGDMRPSRGLPWQREAAEAFVAALRKALFEKADKAA